MAAFTYLRGVSTLRLDTRTCIGCGRCLDVCPHGVLVMEGSVCRIGDLDACMECGACARNCPVGALRVRNGVGCAVGMLNAALGRTSGCCGGDQACCCAGDESDEGETEA